MYAKIKGHILSETRNGNIEVWFTRSHIHDRGANENYNKIIRYIFGLEYDKNNPNKKVNLKIPIVNE